MSTFRRQSNDFPVLEGLGKSSLGLDVSPSVVTIVPVLESSKASSLQLEADISPQRASVHVKVFGFDRRLVHQHPLVGLQETTQLITHASPTGMLATSQIVRGPWA